VAVASGDGLHQGQGAPADLAPTGEPAAGEGVGHLNSVLRGWGTYFAVGNSSVKFHAVDSYVHLRMAKFASKKYGLHGRQWATHFTYAWLTDLGIYRLGGKVRYYRTASARP